MIARADGEPPTFNEGIALSISWGVKVTVEKGGIHEAVDSIV